MKTQRIQNVVKLMKENHVDQLIVSSQPNMFYLTETALNPKERLYVLFIDKDGKTVLVANKMFEVDNINVDKVWYTDAENPVDKLAELVTEGATVAVDKVFHAHFLLELMKKKHANYIPDTNIVTYARRIKDEDEIELMRETCRVNQKTLHELSTLVKEGVTEGELWLKLHDIYNKNGADGYNITPVISFGENAAEVHHSAKGSNRVIKEGDCVMMDMGAFVNGYRSDMTRTFFYKSVSDKMREVYEVVKEAQATARDSVHIGQKFCEIHNIAMDVISKYGYGQYFTHRVGHSIGVEGHEHPLVGPEVNDTVQENMIFSIEPGIYLPGIGGVRIEDLFVVKKDSLECLYDLNRDLTIIG